MSYSCERQGGVDMEVSPLIVSDESSSAEEDTSEKTISSAFGKDCRITCIGAAASFLVLAVTCTSFSYKHGRSFRVLTDDADGNASIFNHHTRASGVEHTVNPERRISIRSGSFWNASAKMNATLIGPNVVMKGPPWLPETSGSSACGESESHTCTTFNQFDAQHVRNMGWNAIRLGVTWAGAQPTHEDGKRRQLSKEWLIRLYAILDICEQYNISVVLEPHQDAWGSANCGQGVPMWFSKLATPSEIGKPLIHTLIPYAPPARLNAYRNGTCGPEDTVTWAMFAGDDDYNVKNPCCLINNKRNYEILFTQQAQKGYTYLFSKKEGRAYYIQFLRLLAGAVRDKPAAVAIELFNEPFPLGPENLLSGMGMFITWRECYEAIQQEVPGMLVGLMSLGHGAISPLTTNLLLPPFYTDWVRAQRYLFFAWHWYGIPKVREDAIHNMQAQSRDWNMPTLLTETRDCEIAEKSVEAGLGGWMYWEYSQYCDTAPASQCPASQGTANCRDCVDSLCGNGSLTCQWESSCNFGACVTGFESNTRGPCHRAAAAVRSLSDAESPSRALPDIYDDMASWFLSPFDS